MKKLLGTSLLAFAVLFTACKKEETVTPTPTVTDNLIGGWMIASGTATTTISMPPIMDTTIVMDIYDGLDSCDKDDVINILADNILREDQGTILCNPNDPQMTDLGTWGLSNNDEVLTFIEDGDTTVYNILSLSASQLNISMTETDDATGMETVIDIHLNKQ